MVTRILALALVFIPVIEQDVQIRPKLVAGDVFTLEVTRGREDPSRPQVNYTSRTPITVKVVSANAKGFILDWTPGSSVSDGPGIKTDPTLAVAARVAGEATLRLVLGPDGELLAVQNEAELLPKFQKVVAVLEAEMSKALRPEEAERLRQMLKQILSPEALVALFTRDAQTYLSPHGLTMQRGKPSQEQVEYPLPFAEKPIPAVVTRRITELTADIATIESTTTIDGDALMAATLKLLEGNGEKPGPDEIARNRLAIVDEMKTSFDRRLGLVSEVSVRREMSAGPVTRRDRWTFKLVTPPKR